MARLPRYFAPDFPLHIIQRGNNRGPIFTGDDDRRVFRDDLADAACRHGVAIHAYVLMTNHIHLVATPERATSLPNTIQAVGRRYVQYFNRRHQRSGTLWEGRYRATLIDSESYLLACMRYVELNPLRAGMVRHPAEYRWSSYHANAHGYADPLVMPHPTYSELGCDAAGRHAAYRDLFGTALSAEVLHAIREATNKAWALGDDRFREWVEIVSGRRATRLRTGRTPSRGQPAAKSRV